VSALSIKRKLREEMREAIENSRMTMSRGRLLTAAVLAMFASGAAAQTTPADPFTPGAAAQSGAPASDKTDAAPAAKPVHHKPKPAAGLTVTVNNKRSVGLVELHVGAAGDTSAPKVAGPLAFGRKTVVHLKPAKDCLYDIHGHFADDADTEQLGVELCKDKMINLTDE
jgi:hypothetical protein